MMSLGVAVRSGRCVDVPGFPQQLCSMLWYHRFDWTPEYTIYRQDLGFGMEDYVAEVLIHAREAGSDQCPYCFLGHGVDEEMAIQRAANDAMRRLRHDLPEIAAGPYRFVPAISSSGEVFYCDDFSRVDDRSVAAMAMEQWILSSNQLAHSAYQAVHANRRALEALLSQLRSTNMGQEILNVMGAPRTSAFHVPHVYRNVRQPKTFSCHAHISGAAQHPRAPDQPYYHHVHGGPTPSGERFTPNFGFGYSEASTNPWEPHGNYQRMPKYY